MFRTSLTSIQVLSNPDKRQVYDIYGKEGLTAGLEIGTGLDKVDELKRKWTEFKAQEVTDTDTNTLCAANTLLYMCMLTRLCSSCTDMSLLRASQN